jgi:hypothetical protein
VQPLRCSPTEPGCQFAVVAPTGRPAGRSTARVKDSWHTNRRNLACQLLGIWYTTIQNSLQRSIITHIAKNSHRAHNLVSHGCRRPMLRMIPSGRSSPLFVYRRVVERLHWYSRIRSRWCAPSDADLVAAQDQPEKLASGFASFDRQLVGRGGRFDVRCAGRPCWRLEREWGDRS